MPTINPACTLHVPLSFPLSARACKPYVRACVRERARARVCVYDLCRLADINIERMHRCRCTMVRRRDPSRTLCQPSSGSLSRAAQPPHFRATRSVLLSPQPPRVFSSRLLSLSLGHVFTLSHPPRRPPFPHSRHPIPDTRYLIMLNASGFCGRIMRPHCPRTLFRSLRAAFSPSLSHSRARVARLSRRSLALSCARRKDL